jgi:hypothetical protein
MYKYPPKTGRYWLSAIAAILMAALATAATGPVEAQQFSATTSTVALNPEVGPAGTSVVGSGANWTAGNRMVLQWANGATLAQTTVSTGGAFRVAFTVPNADPGRYPVTFTDVDSRYFLVAYFTLESPGCQDSCIIAGRARTSDGRGVEGVTMSTGEAWTRTSSDGTFVLGDMADGTHTVTASKLGWTFTPNARSVTIPPNAEGLVFTAKADASPPGDLRLPFPRGETWYVCQGYNGQVKASNGVVPHKGKPALDLTFSREGVGQNGCKGDENASAGRAVTAPGDGTATLSGADATCLNLKSGRSMWIGHMIERVTGTVLVGAILGRTAPASEGPNGGYAHIHVQVHPGRGCSASGAPIPFEDAKGTRFIGAPDLPYSGKVNEYQGEDLKNP